MPTIHLYSSRRTKPPRSEKSGPELKPDPSLAQPPDKTQSLFIPPIPRKSIQNRQRSQRHRPPFSWRACLSRARRLVFRYVQSTVDHGEVSGDDARGGRRHLRRTIRPGRLARPVRRRHRPDRAHRAARDCLRAVDRRRRGDHLRLRPFGRHRRRPGFAGRRRGRGGLLEPGVVGGPGGGPLVGIVRSRRLVRGARLGGVPQGRRVGVRGRGVRRVLRHRPGAFGPAGAGHARCRDGDRAGAVVCDLVFLRDGKPAAGGHRGRGRRGSGAGRDGGPVVGDADGGGVWAAGRRGRAHPPGWAGLCGGVPDRRAGAAAPGGVRPRDHSGGGQCGGVRGSGRGVPGLPAGHVRGLPAEHRAREIPSRPGPG